MVNDSKLNEIWPDLAMVFSSLYHPIVIYVLTRHLLAVETATFLSAEKNYHLLAVAQVYCRKLSLLETVCARNFLDVFR